MITKDKGAISLGALSISPRLSKAQFLVSTMAATAKVFVNNGRWVSYKLSKTQDSGHPMGAILFFEDERLYEVRLWCSSPEDGSGWEEWSKAKELERKATHDALLSAWLGDPPYDFMWGRVQSVFDDRAGSSSISIRYNTDAT